MADLEEIAAAAGISIVEDGGDCVPLSAACPPSALSAVGIMGDGHCVNHEEATVVRELEAMFGARYTDTDPEYLSCVERAEDKAQPPCILDFVCQRQRDENRGGRRGGRGGYNNQGDRERGRARDWGDNRGWNSQPYGRDRSQGYGDYHYNNRDGHDRGYRDNRHRPDDRGYNNSNRDGGREYGYNSYNRDSRGGHGENSHRDRSPNGRSYGEYHNRDNPSY